MSMNLEMRQPSSLEEFYQMSAELAREFCLVLEGRTLHSGVVLHALMSVHKASVQLMPPEERRAIGFAMGAYAGALIADLDAPAESTGSESTAAMAPTANQSRNLH